MITATELSTEAYEREHSSGSIPSLMLNPSGCERSTINLNFPGWPDFGIMPKRLIWSCSEPGVRGPCNHPTQLPLFRQVLFYHLRVLHSLGHGPLCCSVSVALIVEANAEAICEAIEEILAELLIRMELQ